MHILKEESKNDQKGTGMLTKRPASKVRVKFFQRKEAMTQRNINFAPQHNILVNLGTWCYLVPTRISVLFSHPCEEIRDLLSSCSLNGNEFILFMAKQYDESTVKTLDALAHIRLRSGMYIGRLGDGSNPDDGIYVMLKEVIDNSVDEFIMKHGKKIWFVVDNRI